VVYVLARGGFLVHELQLSIGAIVVYADPSIAGLDTFVPLGSLVLYEATNAVLVALAIVAFRLMLGRRRAAIQANIALNALSTLFLGAWWLLSMKSPAGMFIDGLPGLVGLWYFLTSRRVRNTFTEPQDQSPAAWATDHGERTRFRGRDYTCLRFDHRQLR
jgi:hypothetical protein